VNDPGAPSIFLAFAAGLVSFISPCVLPLVPGYLATVSGLTPDELRTSRSVEMRTVVTRSALFILSFTAIFVGLGMTATGLGRTLSDSRDTLEKFAGIAIIAMGVLFVVALFVPMLNREWHLGSDETALALGLGREGLVQGHPAGRAHDLVLDVGQRGRRRRRKGGRDEQRKKRQQRRNLLPHTGITVPPRGATRCACLTRRPSMARTSAGSDALCRSHFPKTRRGRQTCGFSRPAL